MKTTLINQPNLYLLIIYLPVIFPKKQTSEASNYGMSICCTIHLYLELLTYYQ